MTDEAIKTPEELAAEAAGASEEKQAPEVAKDPEPAQGLAAAAAVAASESPEQIAAEAEGDDTLEPEVEAPPAPHVNLNALRGPQAHPRPHPRQHH